jgi:hypothetical protein
MSDNDSGLGMLAGVLAGAMILVLTAMALMSFQPSEAFQMISVSAPVALR